MSEPPREDPDKSESRPGRPSYNSAGLDLGPEPAVVASQEDGYDAEHDVTEATDVQDAVRFRGLVVVFG